MAALMDPYQPENLFSRPPYSGTPQGFAEELDEGDIVKSKPQAKGSAYLPLVNEDSFTDESPRERLGSGEVKGVHIHRSEQTADPQALGVGHKQPPNGQIPKVMGITSNPDSSSSSSALKTEIAIEPEPNWPSSRIQDHIDTSPSDEDSDSRGLDVDSTTALLRRYTMERNGRPTSIHLSPSGEIVGSGWLSEILVSGHKKCAVTLEEDSITWRFLSQKDCEFFWYGLSSPVK